MKTENIHDVNRFLKEHGYSLLTGEACGIGMRILCDLDARAQVSFAEFLGGCTPTHEGMNDRHAKTAMIPHQLFRPLTIYLLLRDGANAALDTGDSISGFFLEGNDEVIMNTTIQEFYRAYPKVRVYYRTGTARNGLVNRHEWSGRIE